MEVELLIQNDSKVYIPILKDGIDWQTERAGVPGQLSFSIIQDDTLDITEGNPIRLRTNEEDVFYGFIFKQKRSKDGSVGITAYDQLRYLKNKDTYSYSNKTAGGVISMIAADFNLQTGTIEDTGYTIESRVEENEELFQIIQNALDLTLENETQMYVMYDDFGKISLKNISSMIVNLLIDEETGESYDYNSSIDSDTYNKIKLTYDNEDTGTRDVYIAQDSTNINSWGVLQHFDTLSEGEDGKAKADALLELYNKKTRTLSISNALGDLRVRAGCMIVVQLDLGDIKVENLMIVEKCKHTFNEGIHTMNLNLRGGEFIA